MPKAVHELAERLKGKSGIDNPFALATYLVNKKRKRRDKRGKKRTNSR